MHESEITEVVYKDEDKEIVKHVHKEPTKVYIGGSIKLGLRNYSSVAIDFGVTYPMYDDSNELIWQEADRIFNDGIMPKLQQYAGKLALQTDKIIEAIEKRGM